MTAAYDASKEIAFTILSMTISLAAVFIRSHHAALSDACSMSSR
jgi:hypothetical protein